MVRQQKVRQQMRQQIRQQMRQHMIRVNKCFSISFQRFRASGKNEVQRFEDTDNGNDKDNDKDKSNLKAAERGRFYESVLSLCTN
jgi:hypothetical protein